MKEETASPVTVCDVQFRSATKFYYFDPGGLDVKLGDTVIVDTAYGLEIGKCVRGNHAVEPGDVVAPLRRVRRLATENDKRIDAANRTREKNAFSVCQKQIEELHMQMQLVSAEYAFDGSKVLFFFTADGRVDFRELVKHLAGILRTRIELRQIGVRDKAKMVGGLGICGRPFCCREFLDDFQPVSIKMAKTQNLSLNPTKISGTCGRLMCCLNYEQEAYESLLRTSPRPESFVDTPDGRGTVTDVNLLRQSVRVRLEKEPDTVVCHKNCDICVLRNGKAHKGDEPIPADLAPISGGKPRRKKEEPEFATYLEPVVIRSSAETLEPAVVSRPARDESEPRPRRRRRKSGAGQAAPAQTAPAETPEKPAEAKPRRPRRKPRRDAGAPKPAEAAEPKPQKPAQKRPAAPAEGAAPAGEGAPNARRRRPPHRRRKPGTKPGAPTE